MRVGLPYRDRKKADPYLEAMRLVGLEPVPFLPEEPASLEELDGLVLMGGTDVDPSVYGEDKWPETDEPDTARDRLEIQLVRQAAEMDMPLLAICRGIQLFNVAHGGTLIQDLREYCERHRQRGVPEVHLIEVLPGTKLAEIIGTEPYIVNSRHHQAVGKIGQELKLTAISPEDKVIEGLERPDRSFFIAVQWHPEDRVHTHERDRRLFEAFAEAVRQYAIVVRQSG